MSINNLVITLMISHFVCSYLIVFKFTKLIFTDGYGFKIRWYDKAAGTYVLALPVFTLIVYLIQEAV